MPTPSFCTVIPQKKSIDLIFWAEIFTVRYVTVDMTSMKISARFGVQNQKWKLGWGPLTTSLRMTYIYACQWYPDTRMTLTLTHPHPPSPTLTHPHPHHPHPHTTLTLTLLTLTLTLKLFQWKFHPILQQRSAKFKKDALCATKMAFGRRQFISVIRVKFHFVLHLASRCSTHNYASEWLDVDELSIFHVG